MNAQNLSEQIRRLLQQNRWQGDHQSQKFFLAVELISSCPNGYSTKRLIKTGEKEPAQYMNNTQIWGLIKEDKTFMDITDHQNPDTNPENNNTKAFPTVLIYQSTVEPLLAQLSIPRMIDFISIFSKFQTRYYESQTGVKSEKWLLSQIRSSVEGYAGSVAVTEFIHPWAQNSIIVRITGSDPELAKDVVVLGAHQDSINKNGDTFDAPGADDNGSGCAVLLESLRVIVAGGFIPKRTLEFHWYAAEEGGSRGSAAIAKSYRRNRVNVLSMVNFDLVGYQLRGRPEIGIYTDYTNVPLSQLLRILVDEYCVYRWANGRCGYGCSDHAAWTHYGFPAAMPSEVITSPNYHTVRDVLGDINFEQVREYSKLAVAYMVEMGEPTAYIL